MASIEPLCPSCSQPNAPEAIQCRWCGEMLGSTRPAGSLTTGAVPPTDWNIADAYWLQPMSILQVLDGAFKIYRDNFALFLAITSVAYVPAALLAMVITWAMWTGGLVVPTGSGPSTAMIGLMCGTLAMFLLVHGVAVPLATGALTRAVSDRYLARPATVRSSYGALFPGFWGFLLTMMLTNLVVGIGILGCCVGMPALQTVFGMVCQIMILERIAGTDAMGRNIRLSDGHRPRIFGFAIIALVVGLVSGWINSLTCNLGLRGIVEDESSRALIEQGVTQILLLLLQPLWSVAWVLMYYDVRIRKEAFDIEMLLARGRTP